MRLKRRFVRPNEARAGAAGVVADHAAIRLARCSLPIGGETGQRGGGGPEGITGKWVTEQHQRVLISGLFERQARRRTHRSDVSAKPRDCHVALLANRFMFRKRDPMSEACFGEPSSLWRLVERNAHAPRRVLKEQCEHEGEGLMGVGASVKALHFKVV